MNSRDRAELSQNISSTPKETRNKSKQQQQQNPYLFPTLETGKNECPLAEFLSSHILTLPGFFRSAVGCYHPCWKELRTCKRAKLHSSPWKQAILKTISQGSRRPLFVFRNCVWLQKTALNINIFDWHVFSKTSRCLGEHDFESPNILRNEIFLSENIFHILLYLYYIPSLCMVNCSAVLSIDSFFFVFLFFF